MVCEKCKSEKEPILCTVGADHYAAVDQEDIDKELAGDCIAVDTSISIWLHVCRDCRQILCAGIEDGVEYLETGLNGKDSIIKELSMFVRIFIIKIGKTDPDSKIIKQAVRYLKKNELQGSVLREDI